MRNILKATTLENKFPLFTVESKYSINSLVVDNVCS